jgi:hypothetical protein
VSNAITKRKKNISIDTTNVHPLKNNYEKPIKKQKNKDTG